MRKFVFMIMVFVLSVGTVDMAFGRADKAKWIYIMKRYVCQREKLIGILQRNIMQME